MVNIIVICFFHGPQAILFEGWMLGFKPVPVEVVKAVDPQV